MKFKLFFSLCIFMMLGFKGRAQESNLSLNLNYNYSFPLSQFNHDLVKDASPRGFTGNLMYKVNPVISLGVGMGYQDYYQRFPREVYNYGKSQQISAVMTNSIQTIPIMARVEYSPLKMETGYIKPYVSIAGGLNMINYNQYLGQFASSSSNTGFRAQAGLGVKIPFTKSGGWGVDLGGTYDYAPYKKFGFKDLNNANVHGGIYFALSE